MNTPWDGGPRIPPVAKGSPEERRAAALTVCDMARRLEPGCVAEAATDVLAMLGLEVTA